MVNLELVNIITKFSESGWDLIDAPAKKWLIVKDETTQAELIAALKKADVECGSCGCEFDPLYKKALELLAA
jgi:hypothetical protein